MVENPHTVWGRYDETERGLEAFRAAPVSRERGCGWWFVRFTVVLSVLVLGLVVAIIWELSRTDMCFVCM